MRTWMSIAGIFLALAVSGMLVGLLGAVVWVGATDDDPMAGVELPSPSSDGAVSDGTPATDAGRATSTAVTMPPTPTTVVMAPIEFSGNGDRTESVAALTAGIAIISMQHDGEGSFKVALQRGDGEPTATLANARGSWEGSRAVLIRDGQQPVLNVEAKGAWKVVIERPPLDDANLVAIPFEDTGSGSQALYYVNVPQGKHTLTATHSGDGQFVVTIMNEVGRGRAKLIDAPGAYDDAVEFESPFFPSSYLILDIRASGDWTLRIE